MKLDVYENPVDVNGQSFSVRATIYMFEYLKNSKAQLMSALMNRIADIMANKFCLAHGDEILKSIDVDQVRYKILNTEIMKDQDKFAEAAISGRCLGCSQKVREWKAPSGSFAPEQYASLRDRGIDPGTGHLKECKYNK